MGPIQNDWYLTKMIWTVQNHFGPIEGKGISGVSKQSFTKTSCSDKNVQASNEVFTGPDKI